jgi:hypothetical protein
LGSDLEDQVRKGESLEARATEAEKKWHEFRHKLEHVSICSSMLGYEYVMQCWLLGLFTKYTRIHIIFQAENINVEQRKKIKGLDDRLRNAQVGTHK